jgi:hypothetical protein
VSAAERMGRKRGGLYVDMVGRFYVGVNVEDGRGVERLVGLIFQYRKSIRILIGLFNCYWKLGEVFVHGYAKEHLELELFAKMASSKDTRLD